MRGIGCGPHMCPLAARHRRYLAAFVEGFKPEQLTLSLLRGAGEIKDICAWRAAWGRDPEGWGPSHGTPARSDFNAKAINEFMQLPTLQVVEAHVERLAVRVRRRADLPGRTRSSRPPRRSPCAR